MVGDIVVEQSLNVGGERSLNARHEYVLHIVVDGAEHSIVGRFLSLRSGVGRCYEVVVLSADHDSVNAHRAMSFAVVFHRYLALRVGAKICHHFAFAAYCSEFDKNLVREVEGERHVVGSLVASIPEHHALVAGALFFGSGTHHALIDVARLFVNSREDAARVAIEFVFRFVVADAIDYSASNVHEVDVGFRFNFACHYHLTGGNKSFYSHLRIGVVGEEFVEKSVGDLVGNFVGMPFRH